MPATPESRASWKRALGETPTQQPGDTAASAAPHLKSSEAESTRVTRLGLLFELREQTPRTASRWNGPVARTASPESDTAATTRLAVRPVTQSTTGRWVRGSLTWANLAFHSNRLSLDPAQQRWFGAFAALQRSGRDLTSIVDIDWVNVDDFASSLLWALLAEAAELDIALVSSTDGSDVVIADGAAMSVDLTRPSPEDDLRVDTVLTVGTRVVSIDQVNPIGDHGIYAWTWTPGPAPASSITVAPTPSITAQQARLLAHRHIRIPPGDLDEFFASYYPRLDRSVPIRSSDGSVTLPEVPPALLVMTAAFAPEHRLELSWHWDYQGERMPLLSSSAGAPSIRPAESGRDYADEAEVEARIAELIGRDSLTARETLQGIDAAEFVATVLPRVESFAGVRVDIEGERPDYRHLTDAPTLTITTVETDHRDWFDLGVIVSVEGRNVPFGALFAALASGRTKMLLIDNSYLSLDHPAFDELLRLIREATHLAEWETGPRISRYSAALWSEFEDLADETVQAATWRKSIHALRDVELVPECPLPTAVTAQLRPYQRQGYDWLNLLFTHRLGGILADDMGLGKTLQALTLIARALEENPLSPPFLVVAPTSVVSGWGTEAAHFLDGVEVVEVTATRRKTTEPLSSVAARAQIVVTSYALFRLDFDLYDEIEWAALILDEAQFVKNPASLAHRCAVASRAPVKFALTGTPIENSLMDLWAMFQVVAPGLFPSARRFTEQFVRPIAQRESEEYAADRTEALRLRIRPLMLRRTKRIVAGELPAKQEQVLEVELSPQHRELYDTYLQRERQKLFGLIDDLDRNRFIVFRSLTLLRMLALDASLIDPLHHAVSSAKLEALLEHLDAVAAEGHRALVFSQFTSFLRLAADRLDAAGIAYSYLDGATRRRSTVISDFRTGRNPVFLISLKAGGFGLNLTEADYVFLLDPWWNPAAENQAIDRTHRIGQTRQVFVYRMVATSTIEAKVMALRDRKAELFDAVMDDDGVFSETLTSGDIRALLE